MPPRFAARQESADARSHMHAAISALRNRRARKERASAMMPRRGAANAPRQQNIVEAATNRARKAAMRALRQQPITPARVAICSARGAASDIDAASAPRRVRVAALC